MNQRGTSTRPNRYSRGLWSNIAVVLRDRIISGQYKPGLPLPTGQVLANELDVDRRTVWRAIEELISEGLLTHNPTCRPRVAIQQKVAEESHDANTAVERPPPSRLIALIMWKGGAEDRSGSVQQRIFWGMVDALAQERYHGVFLDAGPNSKQPAHAYERESENLNYVLKSGFGGVVFFPQAYNHNRELVQEVSKQIPVVFIDRIVNGVQADMVRVENRDSTYRATSYLIDKGHTRIAFVTTSAWISTVEERIRGYVDAIHHSFPSEAFEMVLTPPLTTSHYWPEFYAIAGLPPEKRPTAYVCVNNIEAARVAEYLAELDLKVPDDASIIGFDNADQKLPNGVGLTTLTQPFEEIGKEAARLIIKRIQNPEAKFVHVELPAKLMINDSVGPYRDGMR
jgi:GntR family transcriptional regulator of arabinose operon